MALVLQRLVQDRLTFCYDMTRDTRKGCHIAQEQNEVRFLLSAGRQQVWV